MFFDYFVHVCGSKSVIFQTGTKTFENLKTDSLHNAIGGRLTLICANGMFTHFSFYMLVYNQACHATM